MWVLGIGGGTQEAWIQKLWIRIREGEGVVLYSLLGVLTSYGCRVVPSTGKGSLSRETPPLLPPPGCGI